MPGSKRWKKTRELILYLAGKLATRENYGSILLNKALYFADNISYLKHGNPISEFQYVKQSFGPTPDPAMLLSVRDQLVKAGEIEVAEVEYFGRIQKKVIAKRQADVSLFSVDEIVIIDDVVSKIQNMSAAQISELSHQFPAWKVAKDREELPFFTFLLSSKTPTDADIQWAKAELKRVQGNLQ